jgi:hypothetical protein
MTRGAGFAAALAVAAAALLGTPPNSAAAVNLDALWDYGQPQQSERRFRQLLVRAAGDDALVLRTQIARALGLQKRFEAAHLELDAIESAALGRRGAEQPRRNRAQGRPARGGAGRLPRVARGLRAPARRGR